MNDHKDAWAFVLRHTKMMERLAHRFGPKNPTDREEWLRDVTVRVVEKHHKYNPAKSAPQTWIVWQMRAVTTTWTRRFHKRCREGYGSYDTALMLPVRPDEFGGIETMESSMLEEDASAIVSSLYSKATPEQQVAIRTHLAGMNASTLRKRHKMSGRERTNHLLELRATLEDHDAYTQH